MTVKHRRKLNDDQLEVLRLLYKFRFGTNELFAQYFGKKDRSFVYKRLKILQEQGLVGKRFDSSYRLLGKPAAYYLMPDGARVLQDKFNLAVNVKTIYKDISVSEKFVAHSLELFAIRNRLRMQYGEELLFFTRTDMNREEYGYFPRPLPDAYIRLKGSGKHFFLDIFHDGEPSFVMKQRIKQYIAYEEEGDWAVTDTNLPAVLVVCESLNFVSRAQRLTAKAMDNAWSDGEVTFAFSTLTELMSEETAAWRLTGEAHTRLALQDI